MLAVCGRRKKSRKGVCSSAASCFRCWTGRGRYRNLGDESGLGEEAAFLFLGLAVDGDLDGHLGCVLGILLVRAADTSCHLATYLVNVRLGT